MTELNGSPVAPEALRALALTNYGHFTTMAVEDGRVRGPELHLDRLARDCRVLFDATLDLARVRVWARRAVPATGRCTVRITVFDPALHLGNIAQDADPRVLVTARPAPAAGAEPLRVRSAVHLRDLPEVKGVGLFGVLRLRREARRAGFDDVLFTDGGSGVLEGSTWNVGVVREGRVVWPAGPALAGTARELLRRAGVGTSARVTLPELARCEAVFATNAAVGVVPVTQVDELVFPADHPTVTALVERYASLPAERL
ncbi:MULTISPECIES: aminotransferase class IV [unclassified Streptomyces]|uniref:aminotransferase class IV n=1 Tax=unclassified Streptomyces TaxID=2593676 RepID=UPI000A1E01B6|nr:aminotransferase class IV [Streptomyces sp. 13-12-16]OSP39805.1 aminotransferase [Streptomyces sp. 13-12-16]